MCPLMKPHLLHYLPAVLLKWPGEFADLEPIGLITTLWVILYFIFDIYRGQPFGLA